ncbi:MAG: hypothetical protein M9892_07630 [Bacteroidetes bacterium]|nr:hypothetical protein [Bacteroidota bacterium]
MSNCAPIIYPNFTPAQILTGPPDIFVFRAHNNIFRNYSIQAGNDFNLIPQQTRNGGTYQLLVKKTIAGDVIVTLPAGSIILGDKTASTITLSGAQDEQFIIDFTFSGTGYIFWIESSGGGSQVAPGQPSEFSPNVVPFINASGEWAEDSKFTYSSNSLRTRATIIGTALRWMSVEVQSASPNNVRMEFYNGATISTNHFDTRLDISAIMTRRLLVQGLSDVVGNSLEVTSLTNILLNVANSGNINIAHRLMVGDIATAPTATVEIAGESLVAGEALRVTSSSNITPRLLIGNNGEHAFNYATAVGTVLNIGSKDQSFLLLSLDDFGNMNLMNDFTLGGGVTINAPNGYEALKIANKYTVLSGLDPNGQIGSFAWDNNNLYVRTDTQWKLIPLQNFP